ncbi:MAG: hypothetical protein V3T05_13025, partial [Myxococcota bacterium]
MVTRLISLFLSTVLLAGLGALAVQSVAGGEERALETARGLLASGARQVAADFSRRTAIVPALANRLAAADGLAQDLRALTNAIGMIPGSGRPSDRLRQRIDTVHSRVKERSAAFRETAPGLLAVSFVGADGIVLVTDSKLFSVGDNVVDGGDAEATSPPDRTEDAAEESTGDVGTSVGSVRTRDTIPLSPKPAKMGHVPRHSAGAFFITALDSLPQRATLIGKDGIRALAATAVKLKTKTIGAVIVEVAVEELSQPTGVAAVLLVDGALVLGTAKVGLDPSAVRDHVGAYLMTEAEPHAVIPLWGDIGVAPMFVDAGNAGVWAQNFSLEGAPASRGVVVLDVAPTYAGIAGKQVTILVVVILVWLVHAVMIMLSGRGLRAGITRVTEFLGNAQHGQPPQSPLDERGFPSALVRLVRLVNQSARGGAELGSLAKSPSDDVVAGGQDVDGSEAVADFEFQGIVDSGSIGVAPGATGDGSAAPEEDPSRPSHAVSEDDDGYESLQDVAEAAEADVEAVEAEAAEAARGGDAAEGMGGLPDATDALEAIEHLGDDSAVLQVADDAVLLEEADEAAMPAESEPEPLQEPEEEDPSRRSHIEAEEERPRALSKSPPPPPPPSNDIGDQLDEYAADATTVMQLAPDLIQAISTMADKDAGTEPEPS